MPFIFSTSGKSGMYRTCKINVTQYQSSLIRLLILSGDIALNPGPVKYPCGKCSKPVRKNQKGR
jgi:hypothetical protein